MNKANLKQLEKQIKDLLDSNIDEDSKSGLHNFLGEIYDNLSDTGIAVIEITEKGDN